MKKLFLAITAVFTIALLSACGLAEDDTLRVGMDLSYPPFETEEDGDPEGISVDVAHELGDYLGRDVEIVDTGFGQLIP
ncbi:MAG: transporter substrate-binding domain-containing protein, partial [Candidatus Izemoplasmataceae bacterium]